MLHFASKIRWSNELHMTPSCNLSYVLMNDKWKRIFHYFFPVNDYFSLGSYARVWLLIESQNQKFRRQKTFGK